MSAVEWGAPPPSQSGGGGRRGLSVKNQAIADSLMARPGEWAKVGEYSSSGAGSSLAKAFRRFGKFEVASRLLPNGKRGVWMRFLGPVEVPAEPSNVVALPKPSAVAHPSTQPKPASRREPFECDDCDPPKVFADRHALGHHRRISHRGAS